LSRATRRLATWRTIERYAANPLLSLSTARLCQEAGVSVRAQPGDLVRASEEAERRLPPETPPLNSIPGLNAWRPRPVAAPIGQIGNPARS
jgi:hypothetical protein